MPKKIRRGMPAPTTSKRENQTRQVIFAYDDRKRLEELTGLELPESPTYAYILRAKEGRYEVDVRDTGTSERAKSLSGGLGYMGDGRVGMSLHVPTSHESIVAPFFKVPVIENLRRGEYGSIQERNGYTLEKRQDVASGLTYYTVTNGAGGKNPHQWSNQDKPWDFKSAVRIFNALADGEELPPATKIEPHIW